MKHFFSIFVLAIIGLANIGSAIIHFLNEDWATVFFNLMIAGFSVAVTIHLIRDRNNNNGKHSNH